MTTKPKTAPELRFPGFDGKWKETPLGELADLYQPKTISQTDLTSEGYTVYGANGIIGKYHSFNHEKPQIAVTCRGSTLRSREFHGAAFVDYWKRDGR